MIRNSDLQEMRPYITIFGRLSPALLVGLHNNCYTQWDGDYLSIMHTCISFFPSAHELGLWHPTSRSLSGDELEKLPQSELIQKIEEVSTI